jgi:hypothetical protein
MDKRLRDDLASLKVERESSALFKLVGLFFKLWFVWAFVCLVGAIGFVYVVLHFVAKHW